MPSYQLIAPPGEDLNPLKTLRVTFYDSRSDEIVPTVYCDDHYAE